MIDGRKAVVGSKQLRKALQAGRAEYVYLAENADPAGEEGRAIAQLHKKWLSFTWPKYYLQAHKGLAQMYVCDERFTKYYDRAVPGCAEFLKNAVGALE